MPRDPEVMGLISAGFGVFFYFLLLSCTFLLQCTWPSKRCISICDVKAEIDIKFEYHAILFRTKEAHLRTQRGRMLSTNDRDEKISAASGITATGGRNRSELYFMVVIFGFGSHNFP